MELLQSLWGIILTAGALLLVLTVLVAVHELGHFLFARLFGMEVDTFAVMMGGVRKTDLRPYLAQPMASPWWIALCTLGAVALVMLRGPMDLWQLETVGLFILAVPLPYWVATRLERLYHLPFGTALKFMGQSWAGGMLILALATGFRGMTPGLFFGVLLGSAIVGVLLLYYRPVLNKEEDSPMGHGQIHLLEPVPAEERTALGASDSYTREKTLPVLFRPLLAVKDKRGTEFAFLLLPLGGFAAIRGMHVKEDGSETKVVGGFYSRPAWQRLITLFAGPFFSVAFGVLLLFGYFAAVGEPDLKRGTKVDVVVKGDPADKAGIKPGDEITEINGTKITGFFQMVSLLRDQFVETAEGVKPKPTQVGIIRDGQPQTITVTPKVTPDLLPVIDLEGEPTGVMRKQARIGLSLQPVMVPVSIGTAFVRACAAPFMMLKLIGDRLKKPETATEVIGGPISMAQQSQMAVNQGWEGILQMAAILSIMLGIMNLLPIPPLDGGQMLVAFAEMMRKGSRLSLTLQHTLTMLGLAFVVGLTLLAVVMDVQRQASKPAPPASSAKDPPSSD